MSQETQWPIKPEIFPNRRENLMKPEMKQAFVIFIHFHCYFLGNQTCKKLRAERERERGDRLEEGEKWRRE